MAAQVGSAFPSKPASTNSLSDASSTTCSSSLRNAVLPCPDGIAGKNSTTATPGRRMIPFRGQKTPTLVAAGTHA